MNTVVLSLGSNSQERVNEMHKCMEWLCGRLSNVKMSQAYETPALNGIDDNYMNAVVTGMSGVDYEELNQCFKQYEKDCGRTAESKKNGVIPIDIDIVIWNDKIMKIRDFEQSYFQIGWEELTKSE